MWARVENRESSEGMEVKRSVPGEVLDTTCKLFDPVLSSARSGRRPKIKRSAMSAGKTRHVTASIGERGGRLGEGLGKLPSKGNH